MFKTVRASLIYVAFLSGIASGQTPARVGPPVLGLTPDSAGALRPVIGISRAATVGTPLEFGFTVLLSAVPPNQDYILATTPESQWPILVHTNDGTTSIRALE